MTMDRSFVGSVKTREYRGKGCLETWTGKAVLTLLLLLLPTLGGCQVIFPDNAGRIARPVNKITPLEGIWLVEEGQDNENMTQNAIGKENIPIGRRFGFSQDSLSFSGELFSEVSYKVKRVDTKEYFLHRNDKVQKSLGLEGDEILVITAYSNDRFLFEFIRESEDLLVANIDEQFYRLKKIADEFDGMPDSLDKDYYSAVADIPLNKDQILRSGLLLGVRIPVKTEDGVGDYVYGTYWISSIDHKLMPVLSARDIYLPRMDGFWRLTIEKRLDEEGLEDILVATKIAWSGTGKTLNKDIWEDGRPRVETKLRKAIVYVGNDYVCVETSLFITGEEGEDSVVKKALRTLPVDNPNRTVGIEISDLTGENGTIAMESAINQIIMDLGGNNIKSIERESQKESFALYRKTGHWFFKGRLNLDSQGHIPYMDFSLNLIPPANMVAYDTLQVTWTELKNKIPLALDIFTSPNKDLAVIQLQDEILLYNIENKTLAGDLLARFSLTEGSSIIMAEWSTGEYVQTWENSFTRNNETVTVDIER